ncbi:leucine--tRNA ligase [soil metagenome]
MKAKSDYDHKSIENKWQNKWEEDSIYETPNNPAKKKYVLDMFPYPSGASMHVGHLEGYIGTDILSRYFRMSGYSVLHPMGWDAFGLPAENYAIKTGIHPDESTHKNIEVFKRQLKISGLSYDWTKEIDTSDPDFYRWTQWLFIVLFKKGLAYKAKSPVNWCPKDETVLANEQVIDGKCERCDTPVIQKELDQWFFKITAYADRLISGLDKIDWPEDVKTQQKNWIGKSEGVEVEWKVCDKNGKENSNSIVTFTTRKDTIPGVTFIVVSKASKYIKEITTKPEEVKVNKYVNLKLEDNKKDKSGVFTGSYAKNPFNEIIVPIYVADYVLDGYGTGAVMGMPGHDKRDRDFAKKFDIPTILTTEIPAGYKEEIYTGKGTQINTGNGFDGLSNIEAGRKIYKILKDKSLAKACINYHIRDWLISRQRYWGCPIPMIYCKDCGWQPVPESDLPIKLPTDVDFLPHGESPIATSKTFQKNVVCPNCNKPAKREVDTMDTYVDSSWYFIRFVDPKNNKAFADKEKIKEWLPVDNYVGGGHVVQHLLFSRFFWKVLFDEGLLDKKVGDEPFMQLRAPGWILGPDSRKMSKRWGNVITPDDIIPKFGADVLRLYEMFMGPFDVVKPFNLSGVEGMHRFIKRFWQLFVDSHETKDKDALNNITHQTIQKVTKDIEIFHYNTAISSIMEFVNYIKSNGSSKESLKILCQLLAPFAPHVTEELWVDVLGEKYSVHTSKWPQYDEKYIKVDRIVIVIQVNGKIRSQINIDESSSENKEEITNLALKDEKLQKWISGKEYKIIFIPGKIINFIVSV